MACLHLRPVEPAAGPPSVGRAAGSTLRGGALSSAILYVAIVAIWAGVLIPRWLRRDSSPNSSSEPASDDLSDDLGDDLSTAEPDAPVAEEPAPRPWREDPVPAARAQARVEVRPEARAEARPEARVEVRPEARREMPEPRREMPEPRREMPEPRREMPEPRREMPKGRREMPKGRREVPEARREMPKGRREVPEARREMPKGRREMPEARREVPRGERRDGLRDKEHKRVLSARRRLLGLLMILVIGSGALAFTKLAAWWVIVPPSTMLLGYLALLRAAAKADVGLREMAPTGVTRTAAARRVTASPATASPATAVPAAPPAAPPDAEVIDISATIGPAGEEFYDQYADAKLRAVGDLLSIS